MSQTEPTQGQPMSFPNSSDSTFAQARHPIGELPLYGCDFASVEQRALLHLCVQLILTEFAKPTSTEASPSTHRQGNR